MGADIIVAMAIVLAAGIISGVTGFGFALVSVPPLLMILPPPAVVTISVGLTLVTSWVVLVGVWHEIQGRAVLTLAPWSLLGVVIGVAILKSVDATVIKLLASAVVIGFTAILLRGWELPGASSTFATALAGVSSGTLNATVGMAGPPVVMLFAARRYGVHAFRTSLVAYFVLVDAAELALLAQQRVIGIPELAVAAGLVPAALIGKLIGRWVVRLVSVEQFRRLTIGLLLVTGVLGVVNAGLELMR